MISDHMYDVAIIGAGVSGAFIARELSRYALKIVIVEKENDVSNGTTKANSAIIHAGYDAEPGTVKARLNVEGNPMFDQVCKDLDVPFQRIGSLVIAHTEEEEQIVRGLYERGKINRIPDIRMIEQEEVRKIEPNIHEDVIGALYAPTAGVISPFELTIALVENAMDNGVELRLNTVVTSIEQKEKGFQVNTNTKEITARYVINCAGVYADEINNMVNRPSFTISPRRGQYLVFDKNEGKKINSVIFQCPSKMGKGVLVTPTAYGNLLVGPDAEDLNDKEDIQTTKDRLEFIRDQSRRTSEKIDFRKIITSFAGLRAVASTGDFIIEESETPGFINVAGIQSPGLTASPAIAKLVVNIIKEKEKLEEKEEFCPKRKPVIRLRELNEEEKIKCIQENPRYGKIICRCEQISEGEIIDAIHRNAGGTTVDGIKRRCRPGMGICQGGFCGPRVAEILARELGVDQSEIVKDRKKSYVLIGKTKNNQLYKK